MCILFFFFFFLDSTYMCVQAQLCLTLVTPLTIAYGLLCPWSFPGVNIRVGCHFLLQKFFWPRDPICIGRQILYLCDPGTPQILLISDTIYLSFDVWLTSLNVTISRSILVATNGIILFLLVAEKYFIVYTTSLSIHWSVDIYVAPISWLLWIMLHCTLGFMHIFKVQFSTDICPGVGLLHRMVALF